VNDEYVVTTVRGHVACVIMCTVWIVVWHFWRFKLESYNKWCVAVINTAGLATCNNIYSTEQGNGAQFFPNIFARGPLKRFEK